MRAVLSETALSVSPIHFSGSQPGLCFRRSSAMHEQGGRPPAGTLGVVSWNIHGWKDGLHAANGRRIHELLARLQPDVVALQEVRHPFQRWFASDFGANGQEDPKANELDLLAERLGMSCVFFNPGMNFGGNAILTRLPILRKFEHTLTAESSGDDRALVGVELQLPGYDLR